MSETLALYAGASMASMIVENGKATERYTYPCYCKDTSKDNAIRKMIKQCLEVYSPDNGFFDHDAVMVEIDRRVIKYVYEVE